MVMIVFEEDYSKFRKYADSLLFKHKRNKEADEIINDVYIKFVSSGEEYSYELFRKLIYFEILQAGEDRTLSLDAPKQKAIVQDSSDYKRCTGECGLLLPKAMFYTHRNIRGLWTEAYECKKCMSKRSMEWAEKNPERAKEHERKSQKSISIKKRQGRANLDYWYVKEVLRAGHGYTTEYLNEHPEVIEAHRKIILEKRMKKFNKELSKLHGKNN